AVVVRGEEGDGVGMDGGGSHEYLLAASGAGGCGDRVFRAARAGGVRELFAAHGCLVWSDAGRECSREVARGSGVASAAGEGGRGAGGDRGESHRAARGHRGGESPESRGGRGAAAASPGYVRRVQPRGQTSGVAGLPDGAGEFTV